MLVVVDTNVLVSGLLKANRTPGAIVRLITYNYLQLAYDARIINEYREVLSRPRFGFKKSDIDALITQIEDKGELQSFSVFLDSVIKTDLPDPDDRPFIEVALNTQDRILITGNKKHFPGEVCKFINVLTPSEFWERFLKNEKG